MKVIELMMVLLATLCQWYATAACASTTTTMFLSLQSRQYSRGLLLVALLIVSIVGYTGLC